MLSAIKDILDGIHAQYQIMEQEQPILSTADARKTLKIDPKDLLRANEIIGIFE